MVRPSLYQRTQSPLEEVKAQSTKYFTSQTYRSMRTRRIVENLIYVTLHPLNWGVLQGAKCHDPLRRRRQRLLNLTM